MTPKMICFVCESEFSASSSVIAHVKVFHSDVCKSHSFLCKQEGCCRTFDRFRSFTKHMKTHDVASTETQNANLPSSKRLRIDVTSENRNISDSSVEPVSDFDLSETPQPVNSVNQVSEYETALSSAVLQFLGKLYSHDTITRSHIQLVVDSHLQLIGSSYMSMIKTRVLEIIDNAGATTEETEEVKRMFESHTNMYADLETEHQRFKAFQECGAFIKPEPYVLGQSIDERNISGSVSVVPIDLTGQFIPMRKVLKGFLELPNVFDKIIRYMNSLENRTDDCIENIVQGKLWKHKIKPLFAGKLVLPLCLYFDEYEPCDALGTHSGVHKLGTVYYNIACLPPEHRASLENIFVALFFYAQDKYFGNGEIFRPVLNELKFLEDEGITVCTERGVEQVYFSLCLFLGDNLGVHSAMGFVENFVANYSCRRCKADRALARKQIRADPNLLRDKVNYDADVALHHVASTGIKEVCVWNDLKSFHVCENVAYDIMHDLYEGGLNYDFCAIIGYFLQHKRFSLDTLNYRVQGFNFGSLEIGNKPPIITRDHIKKSKLSFSAAEMLCFVRFFGLMIGDFRVSDDEEVWHFYAVISEIIGILSAPVVTKHSGVLLSNLVAEHHTLYLRLFPNEHLKPKHHLWTHYAEILSEIGPLQSVSCMRFEAKHKPYKQTANVVCNHRNLPHTLAVKGQLKFCFRLLTRKGLECAVDFPQVEPVSLKYLPNFQNIFESLPANVQTVYKVKWVSVCGIRYEEGMVLTLKLGDDYPVFGIIKVIFVDNPTKDLYFVTQSLQTVSFNSVYNAYKVNESEEFSVITLKDIVTNVPTHIRNGPDGCDKYVTFRYRL